MTAACIGAASLSSLCKLLKISLTFPLTISQKDEGTRDLLRVNLCSANDNLCNLCITFFIRTFLFNTGITVSLTGAHILQLSAHSSWGTKNIPRVGGCWGLKLGGSVLFLTRQRGTFVLGFKERFSASNCHKFSLSHSNPIYFALLEYGHVF